MGEGVVEPIQLDRQQNETKIVGIKCTLRHHHPQYLQPIVITNKCLQPRSYYNITIRFDIIIELGSLPLLGEV